jgi:hypothetical protein
MRRTIPTWQRRREHSDTFAGRADLECDRGREVQLAAKVLFEVEDWLNTVLLAKYSSGFQVRDPN